MEDYIKFLENENRFLRDENKTLTMRLSAVKVIVNMINPVCTQKLEELMNTCSNCKGE